MRSLVTRKNVLRIGLLLGIVVLAILVFSPLFGAGFLMLDDSYLITGNAGVLHPSFLSTWLFFHSYDPELYIPLTLLSYQADVLLAGLSPFIFHLHNILLHLGSAVLVFLLLRKLTKSFGVSLFVALIFLFHPVQAEAVSWLSARKDLQSSFFALASLLALLHSRTLRHPAARDMYLLSVVLFACALLSKVSVAVLPLILLLIDRDLRHSRRIFWSHVPFWALSAVFVSIAFFGKTASFGHISPAFSVLIACRSILSSISSMLLPVALRPIYSLPSWTTFSVLSFGQAVLVLILIVCTLIALRRRYQLGAAFTAFIIFFLPTVVTMWKDGVVYLPSDRYLYLAIIPFTLTILLLLQLLIERIGVGVHTFALYGASVLLVSAFAFLLFLQTHIWQADRSLFSYILRFEPQSHVALVNLGNVERAQDRLPQALRYYEAAITAKPDYSIAYRNAASVLILQKNMLRAMQYERHSLALSPESPEGHFGLGILYAERKQYSFAEREFLQTLELSPSFMDAYVALGNVYYAQHDAVKERALYDRGLEIDPTNEAIRTNLAILNREQK